MVHGIDIDLDALAPREAPVRRFSVAEYHRIAEAGVLTENDRVELLEGLIVEKMTHNPIHDSTIQRVDQALRRRLPRGWTIRIQSSLTTGDSEPEPDLAVVREPLELYDARHPDASDTALVVEVAETSLEEDRGRKARIYARAGFVAYWVVNLVDRQLEVHADPVAGRVPEYQRREILTPGKTVQVTVARKVLKIPVSEILPSPRGRARK